MTTGNGKYKPSAPRPRASASKPRASRPAWREWYDENGNYLGTCSARIGPDKLETPSKQPCTCPQCRKGTA